MRLDMIGLRTWLLATVVGWAMLVCALAVAGLGKRVELLPDDPALVQRLPTLPAPAPERLGAFEKNIRKSPRIRRSPKTACRIRSSCPATTAAALLRQCA